MLFIVRECRFEEELLGYDTQVGMTRGCCVSYPSRYSSDLHSRTITNMFLCLYAPQLQSLTRVLRLVAVLGICWTYSPIVRRSLVLAYVLVLRRICPRRILSTVRELLIAAVVHDSIYTCCLSYGSADLRRSYLDTTRR